MFHYIDSLVINVFYSLTGEGIVERHFAFSECFIGLSVGTTNAVP